MKESDFVMLAVFLFALFLLGIDTICLFTQSSEYNKDCLQQYSDAYCKSQNYTSLNESNLIWDGFFTFTPKISCTYYNELYNPRLEVTPNLHQSSFNYLPSEIESCRRRK